MEIIILKNADDVALFGAKRICELVNKKNDTVLGLATGSTPIAMYKNLILLYQQEKISFQKVTTFNLDEYIGIDQKNPQSYYAFMKRELFDAVDIDLNNIHLPTCSENENPRTVGIAYEQAITNAGGIDLQVLGIGSNGHIGFNEPMSSLSSRTRVKTLSQRTIIDNSALFEKNEFQPHLAMTMGVATILDSRYIMLLATGKHKATAVKNAIEGPLTSTCPASALQLHERATIILDQAAASALENTDYFMLAHAENAPLEKRYGNFHEIEPG